MPKVVVLGGGVAGMSAAHELIERGFAVEVFERHKQYVGGKARSVNVAGSDKTEPGKFLPGEHGFRFFPGFYKHIIDTMKRIPFRRADGTMATVFDNLVEVNRVRIARFGAASINSIVNFPQSWADVKDAINAFHANTGLTEEEKTFFAARVWQLMTSCMDRRVNDYEKLGWREYLQADKFIRRDADGKPSKEQPYESLLVDGLTRTLVAANAKYASTKTGGDIFCQLLFNMADPNVHTDRVLNGPTNDAWLNPWINYLASKGVQYHFDSEVQSISMKDGRISGATILNKTTGATIQATGDYHILAIPVERAAQLINADMLAADPTMQGILTLAPSVAWMNGMQFYLSHEVDVVHGHCIYADSQWALTSISQLQFWNNYDIQVRGDGNIRSILSVDISNWETPGFNGKKASECTYEEIKEEVWLQLKTSLNVDGQTVLSDDMLQEWYLDHDIHTVKPDDDTDKEPLLVNTINSWPLRPEASTFIPNLFLASDYVRTYTDLATMEGANEAARRAVNGIIHASQSKADVCKIWNLHEPLLLTPFRMHDEKLYKQGIPWELYEPEWLQVGLKAVEFLEHLFTKKHATTEAKNTEINPPVK
ncbi:FAD-binding protein [Ilyomonas limi]|uniref:FAD-binding protein n=1 Tax=Ilyomonas limi TaxID=2575867 RepID=A0A4U3L2Y5_9BACT|nr:FAD-dependent oxidoreductase [Ilyomonas limi]TKK69280.1 FAD-binding protein [Ilyomonas limi]